MTQSGRVRLAFECKESDCVLACAPPVIFLHCVSVCKDDWGDVPTQVANRTNRKVYVLDARNHGDSEWSDVFDFDVNADDVLDFMDLHEIRKAVLVGHSMGAAAAFKVALKAPERVDMIFSEDMSTKPLKEEMATLLSVFLGLHYDAIEALPNGVELSETKNLIPQHVFDHVPPVYKEAMNIRSLEDLQSPIASLLRLNSNNRYECKTNIKVLKRMFESNSYISPYQGLYEGPVRVAYGTMSPLNVGSDKELMTQHFPNVEFVAVEGGGHHIHNFLPEKIAREIIKFISSPIRTAFTCIEPEGGATVSVPVIFLHGLNFAKEDWKDIPADVANITKRKVYALDARNHGDSEWNDVFDFDINVDDVLYFMDSHDIPKAVLVGFSMGAYSAVSLALKEPDRVEKVFVEGLCSEKVREQMGAIIPLFLGWQEAALQSLPDGLDITAAQDQIRQHVFDNMPSELKTQMQFNSPADLVHAVVPYLRMEPDGRWHHKTNIAALKKAFADKTFMAPWDGVYEGPVGVIHGTHPTACCDVNADEFKKHLPNIEYICIDGVTTLTMYSAVPKQFTDALVKFIS